jgi:hypothetical protein
MKSDFTCVICRRDVDQRWGPRSGPRVEIAPICVSCETVKYYAWNGGARCRSAIKSGSVLDRRNANRIEAIADALASEANKIQWSHRHAAA